MLAIAPLGVLAPDLVVWWETGYCDQEDEAVREIIATFEFTVASRWSWPSIPKRSFKVRF
jgi:hypothetical protein